MSNWPRVPLGELLSRADSPADLAPDTEYHEVTIRLWGKGVVSRGKVRGADVTTARRFVRSGQLILSKIDARNGALGMVPPELDGAIVSNDFPSFELQEAGRCLPAFMSWLVQSRSFVDLCKASSEGTTNRVRIKEDRFLRQSVRLPPLAEQRAIVARLDALADKTRTLTVHLDAIEAETNALILAHHFSLAAGSEAPLSEFLELHEESILIKLGEEYPQVGVRSFGGGLFAKSAILASDTTYRSFNQLYADAIVLSQVKGWEGAIALTHSSLTGMFVSPEYRTFRCRPERAVPGYLGELLKTPWFWSLLQDATRGVGARRERTRPDKFLNVLLPMPSVEEQIKACEVFASLRAVNARYAAIRADNAALLPSVLERIFVR